MYLVARERDFGVQLDVLVQVEIALRIHLIVVLIVDEIVEVRKLEAADVAGSRRGCGRRCSRGCGQLTAELGAAVVAEQSRGCQASGVSNVEAGIARTRPAAVAGVLIRRERPIAIVEYRGDCDADNRPSTRMLPLSPRVPQATFA